MCFVYLCERLWRDIILKAYIQNFLDPSFFKGLKTFPMLDLVVKDVRGSPPEAFSHFVLSKYHQKNLTHVFYIARILFSEVLLYKRLKVPDWSHQFAAFENHIKS